MNGTDNCFGLSFGVQGALLENEAGKIEKHGNLVKMSSVLSFFVDKDGLELRWFLQMSGIQFGTY